MSVDVQTEMVIDRSLDTVGRCAADPSNAPEWYVNIDSVEWMATPPPAVGSRVAFVARILGRRSRPVRSCISETPSTRPVRRHPSP